MSTHQQHDESPDQRQRKHERFEEKQPGAMPRSNHLIAIGVIVLLAIIGTYLLFGGAGDDKPSAASAALNSSAGDEVRIPLTDLADGRAKFYRYDLPNDRELQFFAVRSVDGVVRAALNACDTCYQARQGYRQEGNEMVCNKCDQRFPTHLINVQKGGCNPVPLDRAIVGDQLVIRARDLQAGAAYF
ncbi:MAG: DUF2318 domain-containing protein [Acidobacteria bacterium]|nr:DUF2318 domain-containing protein [Acidobacteriota bacterium]